MSIVFFQEFKTLLQVCQDLSENHVLSKSKTDFLQNAFKIPTTETFFSKHGYYTVLFIQFKIDEEVVVVLSTYNKSCQNNAKPHFSVEQTYNFFFVFQVQIA